MNIEEKRSFLKKEYLFLPKNFCPPRPSNFLGSWVGDDKMDNVISSKVEPESILEATNFKIILEYFQEHFKEEKDFEVICYNHWAYNSLKFIAFKTFDGDNITEIAKKAEDFFVQLDVYPVLDDDRYSEEKENAFEYLFDMKDFSDIATKDSKEQIFLDEHMDAFKAAVLWNTDIEVQDNDGGPELTYNKEIVSALLQEEMKKRGI